MQISRFPDDHCQRTYADAHRVHEHIHQFDISVVHQMLRNFYGVAGRQTEKEECNLTCSLPACL